MDSTSDPLDAIVEQFVARLRRGERPAVGEYIARYPEHAAAIQEMFPALVVLERLKPDGDPTPAGEPSVVPTAETLTGRLGDFRIVREVGRGGMGIVYEAVQESLGRQVALKVLPKQTTGDFARQARFEREARAAARLHHTHIVPVFEVGDADGWHFYAMQYIHGLGLDEVLRELRRQRALSSGNPASASENLGERGSPDNDDDSVRRSLSLSVTHALGYGAEELPVQAEAPQTCVQGQQESSSRAPDSPQDADQSRRTQADALSNSLSDSLALSSGSRSRASDSRRGEYWRSVARLGAQAASALQYAHEQGVLHRDIKPSNLLLDTRGVIWLTDFGLAKTDDQRDLTRTGDILGTLRYMAPEVFSGTNTARSDMYSLGLTLYEMLALRPAYDEPDRGRLIRLVLHESPPRLRTLDPSIPRDLETIIHKAIDREPLHRYGSAREFADDLQRFLNDEPIEAQRISPLTRTRRWCRRNPLIAGLLTTVTLLLLAAISASIGASVELIARLSERNSAIAAAEFAERQVRKKTIEAQQASREAREAAWREQEVRQEVERQRDRARVNFARARSTVDKYLSKIADQQLLSVPGLHALREELLAESLKFYDEFARENVADASLQIEFALALHRRGKIFRELGRLEESSSANAETIRRLEALREQQQCGAKELSVLAEAYLFAGRYDECVELCTSLVKDYPDSMEARSTLSEAYNALAVDDKKPEQFAVMLSLHQKAFAIREQLLVEQAERAESYAELGATLNNIGSLLDKQKRTHEALAMYELSIDHTSRACQLAPHSILWGRWDSIGHQNVSRSLLALGQDQRALETLERRIVVRRRLLFQNPSVPSHYTDLNKALTDLGDQQQRLGRAREARRSYREAIEVLALVPREAAADMFQLAMLYAGLMTEADDRDDTAASGEPLDEDRQYHADLALEALKQAVLMGWADPNALKTSRVLDPLRQQTQFLEVEAAASTIAEAAKLIKEPGPSEKEKLEQRNRAADLLKQYAEQNPRSILHQGALAAVWESLGETQLALGQLTDAERSLQAALEIREQRLAAAVATDSPPAWTANTLIALDKTRRLSGNIAWAQGDHSRAVKIWSDALAHLERQRAESRTHAAVDKQLLALIASAELELANRYGSLGLFKLASQYAMRAVEHQAAPTADLHNYLTALPSVGVDVVLENYLKKPDLWEVRDGNAAGKSELLPLLLVTRSLPIDPERIRQVTQASLNLSDRRQKLAMGYAQFALGDYDKSKATLIASFQATWQFPFALAMMEHQLGNREAAERMLQQGEAEVRHVGKLFVERAEAELHPPGMARGRWWEYAHFLATRRRAWELIRQQAAPDDPWMHLVQARGYRLIGESQLAESEYAEALALAPRDVDLHLAVAMLEKKAGATTERISARLNAAVDAAPADPRPLIARGRWHAERGEQELADADYARAAERTPDELNRFLEAGWWGVGPYLAEVREFGPPELTADPAQPAPVIDVQAGLSEQLVPWSAISSGFFGRLDLSNVPGVKGDSSAYALTHVYSSRETTSKICVSASKLIKIWLNGEFVCEFDPTMVPGTWSCDAASFPVTMRRGRNVLLVKSQLDPMLHVRLADHPYEQGMEIARNGLWKEAADRVELGLNRNSESYTHASTAFMHLAAFRLAAGEYEAVRRLYAKLQAQPNWADLSPGTTSCLNWIGSLAPGIADDADVQLQRAKLLHKAPDLWHRDTVPMVYSRLGRWQEVVDFYASETELRKQSHASPLLALAHHHLGNTQESQTLLAKSLQIFDHDFTYWNRVVLHAIQTQWALPREASLAITGSASTVDQRFKAIYEQRRAERSTFPLKTLEFDTALQFFSENYWHWLARGRRRAELGDVEGARADFLKAKELAPQDRGVAAELGDFLAQQGEIGSAADEFRRVLHLPDQGDWLVKGRELESRMMAQPKVLDDLLSRWPEYQVVHRLRGERLARLGQWEEARVSFDSGPDCWSHAAASAALSLLLDDQTGYQAALERTRHESVNLPPELRQLQTIVECLGPRDSSAGQRILTEVRQLKPTPNILHQQLSVGLAEYRVGNYEQSLNELSQAKLPTHGWQITCQVWPAKALAHARLVQVEEARRCLDLSARSLEFARQATLRRQIFGGPLAQDVYWLFTLALHREARTLLDGPEAAAKEMAHFRNVGDLLAAESLKEKTP